MAACEGLISDVSSDVGSADLLLRWRCGRGAKGRGGAPQAVRGALGRADDLSAHPLLDRTKSDRTRRRSGWLPPKPKSNRRTERRVSDSPKIWTYDDSAFRDTATTGMKRRIFKGDEIGRAHVRTPVTKAHIVCRLMLEKKKNTIRN